LKKGIRAAGAAILLLAVAAPAQEDGRPKIFLEKKVFADTSEGKKSFYEVHTVLEGENLWKILSRRHALSQSEYAPFLKEFLRANPRVTDPGMLKPGQKILLPSAASPFQDSRVSEGKMVPHRVIKGDNLTKLLKKQGVSRKDLPRYMEAVKGINDSVRDVNRILAGTTILLPTESYFSPAQEPPSATVAGETPKEEPAVALSRDVPPEPGPGIAEPARPEAQLRPPDSPPAAAPVVETAKEPPRQDAAKKEEPSPPPPKPPYRGLLTDLLAGLGEKWADRGTLYLPVPSGGEVILNLEDFPVARFSNGTQVLIDFRGALPQNVRALITDTWKNYRVVSLEGTQDAGEIVHRLLQASGYHSVKEGIARPLVIGEGVSVVLPARWVVLRTPKSLLTGEVILIKEVPERPSGNLAAVLRYADRVGIRVLPFATDRSALEGFLVGIDDPAEAGEPPRLAVPPAGLPALDFALDFLSIPKKEGERLKIGGKGAAFQLVVEPERTFETGGKRHVVDTGRMAPALRTLVQDSGFAVFPVRKDEPGKTVFQRVLKEAGIPSEDRRDYLLAGGEKEGYSVRVTGTFVTSKEWLESRKTGGVMLFGGRVHSATRALLRDIGVEIVEW
jgi:LysM repeat protein